MIGIIWKIRIWNMKKIGKKKLCVTDWLTDMISTFRAFASGVRELKILWKESIIRGRYLRIMPNIWENIIINHKGRYLRILIEIWELSWRTPTQLIDGVTCAPALNHTTFRPWVINYYLIRVSKATKLKRQRKNISPYTISALSSLQNNR